MESQPDDAATCEPLIEFLYRAPIGLVQSSLAGDIDMINPMSASLLMLISPGSDLSNLFEPLDRVAPQLRKLVTSFGDARGTVCESMRIPIPARDDGELFDRTIAISLFKLDERRLMCTLADVTAEVEREARRMQRRLDTASRTDPLTGLPNRVAVLDSFGQTMRRVRARGDFAVLYLNCDRFRQINDALGRAVGDQILKLIAGRVRSMLQQRAHGVRLEEGDSGQDAAARLGGDEFAVLLEDLSSEDEAHALARRMVDALGQPYAIDGRQVHCSVSIGVVLGAQINPSATADTVLQTGSVAMREAKRAGRSRHVVFQPEMEVRSAALSVMEAELRVALIERQLFVVYQPVVGFSPLEGGASDVNRSAGVEALVRWRHPTRGVVPPLEFISVAEECGLIDALGGFVLRESCAQFARWKSALGTRAPKMLAVNLSRGQLGESRFAESVAEILRATGMHPSELQLEVTESLAAQDDVVQSRLHELKALGLTLALDDFGTGYSSLASLHLLPVDTVKIDRSFVSQAVESHHHRVLIEATIRVASSLRMGTVAEGIETIAQLEVVRSLGCQKGQGYIFSKPLSVDALAEWLLTENDAEWPPVLESRGGGPRATLSSPRMARNR